MWAGRVHCVYLAPDQSSRFLHLQRRDDSRNAATRKMADTAPVAAAAAQGGGARSLATGIACPLREPNLWQYTQVNSAPSRKICAE